MNTTIKIDAKSLRNFFMALAIISAVIAFFMIFAPAIKVSGIHFATGSNYTTYSGIDVCFGSSDGDYTPASANMVTYILLIIGIVFAILASKNKLDKVSYIIAIIAFALATLGFILTDAFIPGYGKDHYAMVKDYDNIKVTLGSGVVTGIITSFIALISEIISLAISKKYHLIF